MMLITSTVFEYSSSACQSICENVERNYPHFAQSSGKLLAHNYYLLNSSLLSPRIGDHTNFVIMRVDHLGKATKEAIGEIGCARFDSFLTYEAGWNGGDAKPLSLESVAMIEVFVANFNNFATEPSLFLTQNGNLKLGWEDSTGGAIEVEFMPSAFKYYIERRDEEGSVKIAEVNKLISKILSIKDAATTA
jgi:hypothetical protein